MDSSQIPSASQSMARVVDTMHDIAQSELPRGAQVGIVETQPPNLVIKMNNIEITSKKRVLLTVSAAGLYPPHGRRNQ